MSLGSVVCQLAPGAGNPRNSEGAFLTLKDGRILFVFSRYCGDTWMDHASADLAAITSADGGVSWSKPQTLFSCREAGVMNLMSVSLMRMADGGVGLFYLSRVSWSDLRMKLARSYDEGEHFGEPVTCMDTPRYYVVNNDRVIRTAAGRLIIPAASHDTLYRPNAQGLLEPGFDSRAAACFFLSDDDGRSFRMAPGQVTLGHMAHSSSGLQEPGVVELRNGVLWAWARTDLGRQYEMFSLDGGEHWTDSQPSWFTGPCSPLSVKRLPDGRLLAVWNPVPLYNGADENAGPSWNGGRTPLVLAVSGDEAVSWSRPKILEDQPDYGYCYTAIHPMEDAVLLAYCGGGPQDKGCLNRLVIRRIEYGAL